MLRLKGWNGLSLVASAAYNGDKTTFETVLTTVRGRLGIAQVRLWCLAIAAEHFRFPIKPTEHKFNTLVSPFYVIPPLVMIQERLSQSDAVYRSYMFVAMFRYSFICILISRSVTT